MKNLKTSMIASGFVLAVLSGNAFGEAGISYSTAGTPDPVTANVKFKITIPQIMILRVGDWSGTVNTVEWDYAFGTGLTSPTSNADGTEAQWDATDGAALATLNATGDDDANASDGSLAVAAFGNTGADLSLVASVVQEFTAIGAGAKPSVSEISAPGATVIPHPADFVGAATTLTNASGIVRKTDTWTYKYTPAATPVGGVYNAEVKYTLTSL